MNNASELAFPFITRRIGDDGNGDDYCGNAGLTKREVFALAAMQGILSCYNAQQDMSRESKFNGNNFSAVIASNAVDFADALLAELDKRK